TGARHAIRFPEPVYTAFPSVNRVWDTQLFRYSYQASRVDLLALWPGGTPHRRTEADALRLRQAVACAPSALVRPS
ncbi:MAG: hypothetical protein LAO04_20425, partial [Acidobacteriia bacterium]|nr:hypothetical protein [Terriglobia bacterium]